MTSDIKDNAYMDVNSVEMSRAIKEFDEVFKAC